MAALPVAVDEVKRVVGDMIKKDGLETVTSSKIRKHLQKTFDVDFTEYKKTVDEITKEVIEEQQKDDSGSETDSDEEMPQKKDDTPKSGNSVDSSDSDDGPLSTDRARPAKRPLKRKAAAEDENLDLMSKIKTGRRSAAKDAANKLKKAAGWSSRKTTTKKDDKDKCKITKGTKLVYCSEELQDLTGQKFMRRCDVVKELWKYMRDHERMDPKDKRFARIEGDPALEKVFKGKKRLQMFGVMGHLGKHLLKPEDVGQDLVEECEEYREQLIADWEAKKASLPTSDVDSDEVSKDVPDDENSNAVADESSRDVPQSKEGTEEPPPAQNNDEKTLSDSD